MRRKTILLTVGALSAMALAALPSSAAAFRTTPALSLTKGTFPAAFTGTGGAGTFFTASGRNITAESSTAEGEFENAHTGTAKIIFHGVRESIANSTCATYDPVAKKTVGASGEVTVHAIFHTVYGKPTNLNKPHETTELLFTVTPLTFKCLSDLITIQVRGNVLGTVTPGLEEEPTGTFNINVSATEAGQEHTEITDENEAGELITEKFGLESNLNGGAFEPAYENAGPQSVTLSGGAEGKTTTKTP